MTFRLAEENDVFVEVSPKRSIMSRRKSLLKASNGVETTSLSLFSEVLASKLIVTIIESFVSTSMNKEPGGGRKSHGKVVTFGSLPTELTVRSAKDCLKHMYSVKSIY